MHHTWKTCNFASFFSFLLTVQTGGYAKDIIKAQHSNSAYPPICTVRRNGKGDSVILSKISTCLIFNLLICSFFNEHLSLWNLSGHLWLEMTILWCGNLGAFKVSVVFQVVSQNLVLLTSFLKFQFLEAAGCIAGDHGRWDFWTA